MTPVTACTKGVLDSLSIGAGYFPIAVSFALTALQADVSPVFIFLISLILYAGASQFVFVSLIAAGSSFVTIVATIFLINLRHIFYGNALLRHLPEHTHLPLPIIAFGLTDEVYAAMLTRIQHYPTEIREYWYLGLQTGSYIAWLAGTATGCLFGAYMANLSPIIQKSFAFILPALFLALLLQLARQIPKHILFFAAFLCSLFLFFLPDYLTLVFTMLGTALYAGLLSDKKRRH